MLRTLADAYREAGCDVIGAAPTARAARELRDVAGIAAGTVDAVLGRLDRGAHIRPGTVLLLDEAGMAGTRITARIVEHAERGGVKIVAVGDPGQLASVQAGGWLAALTRQTPGPQLREVIRQRDPEERRALEALHDGNPDGYLARKGDDITIHGTQADAINAVIDEWAQHRAEDGASATVMIARDNHTRELLNTAVRQRLTRDGALVGTRESVRYRSMNDHRTNRPAEPTRSRLATTASLLLAKQWTA